MSSCEIDNIVEFLGKKHMLSIIKILTETDKPLRYGEIINLLNINSKTLSDRLKELEVAGVVTRYSLNTIPPHVEYSLNVSGEDFLPIIEEIVKWENKHGKLNQVKNKLPKISS